MRPRSADIFSTNRVDGARFWEIVAGVAPFTSFSLQSGIAIPEWLYPCDDPAARFSRSTGVPLILVTTLPHLTSDHERLFQILETEVTRWPVRPMGDHYRQLFGRLANSSASDYGSSARALR